jgi:parvulin-like peptidyl-prolyl isomerase
VAAAYGPQALTDQNSPFYRQFTQLQPGQEYLLGDQVLNEMIEEILIRKEAVARDISVDEAMIEEQVQGYFGFDPNPATPAPTVEPSVTPTPVVSPTPSPEPTATEVPQETPEPTAEPLPTSEPLPTLTVEEMTVRYSDAVEQFYADGTKFSGLSRDQIKAIFEADALRKLLYDDVTGDTPAVELQVDARHILVDTEQEANDILAALAEGESFADLARVSSKDTGSGRNGGELGWAGRGRYVAEFEDAVFNAEIGQVVGPIQTQFGYHIIEVHAREERTLTDSELSQKRQTEFQTWLSDLRTNAGDAVVVNDYFSVVPSDPTLLDLGLGSIR